MKLFLILFTASVFTLLMTSCKPQKEYKDPSFQYFYHRNGNQLQELKLKFNPSKTEITEAYYKPIGEKNYIPLEILSKNDTPLFYLVNYTEINQAIKLFTDFGAGASLYFSNDQFITFNKEYFIASTDKKSVLITSGLPSFTPFFLTDDKNTFIHQFLLTSKDSENVTTHPDYPNSIVFDGSFTNGQNAKIIVFPNEKNNSNYTLIVEFENNKKLIFNQNFE